MSSEHAEAFMLASDAVYDECQAGIATLDKIIVSCSSLYTNQARNALVPALYAYWERFFRVIFAEFLHCASVGSRPLHELNHNLGRLRLRRELETRAHTRDDLLRGLQTISGAQPPPLAEARKLLASARDTLHEIEQLCDAPLSFVDPETWIVTESNVRFEVIERNCKRLGLDVRRLKSLLEESQIFLHPSLKDLVDTRNGIAHGDSITPLQPERWEALRSFTLSLMNATQLFLLEAISDDGYLLAS
ncbi:MAG: hypothetical protein EOO73_29340 [Myxococcales bacterium]|nr:MAG: hypothetical protein EOO73_29340 [Myxococcales bacterium]